MARRLDLPARLCAAAPKGVPRRSAEALVRSERVLASLCEAVIGSAYLAFGFERVHPAVAEAFGEAVEEALERSVDFKSLLQERLARRAELVSYAIEAEEGPPHDRSFVAVARVAGQEIGRGAGKTKKGAEQEAASVALDHVEENG